MILPVPQSLPIGKIIGHPYEGDIANFKEKEYSIDRLSSLIHDLKRPSRILCNCHLD